MAVAVGVVVGVGVVVTVGVKVGGKVGAGVAVAASATAVAASVESGGGATVAVATGILRVITRTGVIIGSGVVALEISFVIGLVAAGR